MGLQHNTYLAGHVFGCNQCYTHLSTNEEIISKSFQGQHGRAFLFKTVVNVTEGPREERCMTTGRHVVRNIYCRKCGCVVGWKYEKAYDETQRYKEGHFILEKELLAVV